MTYNKAVFPRGMQPFLRFDKLILLRRSYLMEELNCRTSEIAGASFTLSPMSDDFVEVIESTLSAVNTSKVWLETDDVSTRSEEHTSELQSRGHLVCRLRL